MMLYIVMGSVFKSVFGLPRGCKARVSGQSVWRTRRPALEFSLINLSLKLPDLAVTFVNMGKAESSASIRKGCWLYPISERAERRFILDDGSEYPVSIDTFKMLVGDGRISEDERWGLHINFRQARQGDEVFIYTGDQDLGIVGFATVKAVDLDDRELILNFDISKCKALLLDPVPAKIVRKWIPHPRAAVIDLSAFRADLYGRLPWSQHRSKRQSILISQSRAISAGFGTPENNRKVEKAAINRVTKTYRSRGWEVTSVEDKKLGFDLLCKKGTEVEKVEVKGVKGREVGFLLTAGEFRKASEDSRFVLCVVLEALSKRSQLKTWSGKEMLKSFDFLPLQYQALVKPPGRSR